MRWGAGAGASRLISGSMEPHRAARAAARRVQGLRGGAAVRLRLPRQHRRDRGAGRPRRGRLQRRAQPRQHHRRLPARRGPRPSSTATRDLEHLAWGLRAAGGRGSLIVTDGLFSMDGDLAPLEGLVELARRHRCRLMVDEAHAIGAVGPGRARHRRRRRPRRRGRPPGRDPRQGARLLRRLRLRLGARWSSTCSTPPARSSSRPRRRPRGGGGRGGAGAARGRARRWSSASASTPRSCARRSPRRASPVGGSQSQIVPVGVGDSEQAMGLCERLLEHGVFAQGIRPPTVPEGTSRLRFTAMSTHDAGGCAARRGCSARPPAASAWARRGRRPARRLSPRARGLRHRHRHRGRQDRRRGGRSPARWRLGPAGVAVFKPAVTGLEEPGEPDHELLRRAAGSEQSDEEIAPYRYGPPASPHLGRLAGGRGDRPGAAARRGRGRGGAGADGSSARASAASSSRSPPTTRSATSPSSSACRWSIAAAARPRHDQPHAAHPRGGARASASRSRWSSSRPGPRAPSAVEASNRETIAALG